VRAVNGNEDKWLSLEHLGYPSKVFALEFELQVLDAVASHAALGIQVLFVLFSLFPSTLGSFCE